MGKDIKDLKIVNCHLGQGASICAIKDGKSVETSMGLTPLGGIPMGSRSGDLDPSIITFLMQKENLSVDDMNYILNKESVIITEEVIDEIEKCSVLAPLHNPNAIAGIRACQKVVPNVKMVAVFDTAFHQTLPQERYIYPIAYEYYKKYGIRK